MRAGAGKEKKDAGGKEIKRKEERKEERGRKRKGGEKRKEKEVEGQFCENRKNEEGGCKMQGVGKEKGRGKPYGFGG